MNFKTVFLILLSLVVVENSFAMDKKKKITISGYVYDGDEKPLQGVNIIVDGENTNKVTNYKGFYKVKVDPGIKSIMAFTLLNGGVEIDFPGRTKINFILAPNTSGEGTYIPKEKLIDIGYGMINETDKSSSANVIKNDESENMNYRNIYEMIQGKVPGVTVSGNSIIIRGVSSFRGDSQPLFVVDGIVSSSIDMINPKDVKSISVLKGSDTAIYGVRGANGVIVITLKKGIN